MRLRFVPIVIAISVTGCLAVVLWGGAILLVLGTTHQDYARYSLKYWMVCPPKDLREAPVFQPANRPGFQYHPAWEIPETNDFLLRYRSRETVSAIHRNMDAYLTQRGWRLDTILDNTYLRDEAGRFRVIAIEKPEGTDVTLVMMSP